MKQSVIIFVVSCAIIKCCSGGLIPDSIIPDWFGGESGESPSETKVGRSSLFANDSFFMEPKRKESESKHKESESESKHGESKHSDSTYEDSSDSDSKRKEYSKLLRALLTTTPYNYAKHNVDTTNYDWRKHADDRKTQPETSTQKMTTTSTRKTTTAPRKTTTPKASKHAKKSATGEPIYSAPTPAGQGGRNHSTSGNGTLPGSSSADSANSQQILLLFTTILLGSLHFLS